MYVYYATGNVSEAQRPRRHMGTGITIPDAEGPLHEPAEPAPTPASTMP